MQKLNDLSRSLAPLEPDGTLIAYRCLPTGVTGSRSRPTPPGFGQIVLCRPDAWVRVSFAHTRVSIVGWIYDPDHSLPPGMYVDVPHLDCLLVAAPITVEGLDHLILKPKQLDAITAVYVDVVFGHVAMAPGTSRRASGSGRSASPLTGKGCRSLSALHTAG